MINRTALAKSMFVVAALWVTQRSAVANDGTGEAGFDPSALSAPTPYSPSSFTQSHIIDPITSKLDDPIDKWSQNAVMAVQLSAAIDPTSNGQLSSEDQKTIAMIGVFTDMAKNTIKGIVTNAVAIKPAY